MWSSAESPHHVYCVPSTVLWPHTKDPRPGQTPVADGLHMCTPRLVCQAPNVLQLGPAAPSWPGLTLPCLPWPRVLQCQVFPVLCHMSCAAEASEMLVSLEFFRPAKRLG